MSTSEQSARADATEAARGEGDAGRDNGGPVPEPRAVVGGRPRLGDLFLAQALVTEADIEAALDEQRRTGARLGDVLLAQGLISPRDLARVLGLYHGVEFVDLDDFPIDASLSKLLPERLERNELLLPIARDGDRLVVAFADPGDVLALDDAQTAAGVPIRRVIAERGELERALDRVWHERAIRMTVHEAEHDMPFEATRGSPHAEVATAVEAPIVRLVNTILAQAISEGASDVHVEPDHDVLRIRIRVDGVLHDSMEVPQALRLGLLSRLKVMSGLDIAERRRPQDGRVGVEIDGRRVDVRVATLPTSKGEAVSLRILGSESREPLGLVDLGFLPEDQERYHKAFRRANGAMVVTGPTGSGKTTTLYATLHELNRPDRSIVTVEDPVERELPGVKQIPINTRAGVNFATALRSILRADPDVIMIGEVRDRETASIAAEAAITGHLVLTTLHTNDAASTPLRLVEMGIEPYVVTAALGCVIAQRLVRRLCHECRDVAETDPEVLEKAGFPLELFGAKGATGGRVKLARPVGCPRCANTGYRGRIGLFEVMSMSEAIGRLVIERASTDAVRNQAVAEGMATMRDAGLQRVAAGETSLEELLRVLG